MADPTDDELRRTVAPVPMYEDDENHAYHIRLARAVLDAHGAARLRQAAQKVCDECSDYADADWQSVFKAVQELRSALGVTEVGRG